MCCQELFYIFLKDLQTLFYTLHILI
jgi:hypothetical protein